MSCGLRAGGEEQERNGLRVEGLIEDSSTRRMETDDGETGRSAGEFI
jgi:hypothetical protein